jgi:hypothetical protein
MEAFEVLGNSRKIASLPENLEFDIFGVFCSW